MKVFKSSFPGWNNYPVYQCMKSDDWHEVSTWMHKNSCDHFLLSSGNNGYTFQVRKNYEWFILRWT